MLILPILYLRFLCDPSVFLMIVSDQLLNNERKDFLVHPSGYSPVRGRQNSGHPRVFAVTLIFSATGVICVCVFLLGILQ